MRLLNLELEMYLLEKVTIDQPRFDLKKLDNTPNFNKIKRQLFENL
jgi:hypothetical protein